MERDHWDTLFDELYLRTYARLEHDVDDEGEALGAAALAGVEPGADVLDAPCGYGRHSIVLARAGYRVVGADRSPVLLDEARRRAGDGEWPQWVNADHRELPFEDASFDAALNLFSALGYRGEEGDRRTLGELRRVLRPGGRLVVETMHRDRLMHVFQSRGWHPLPGGDLLLEERTFDYAAGEIETTHSLVEADGNRESLTYRFRVYTATELVRLVQEAGFTATECLGGWNREPFSARRSPMSSTRSTAKRTPTAARSGWRRPTAQQLRDS
jgi:ubiquinone/menaquinone biosynthesis C-methylase UbiE